MASYTSTAHIQADPGRVFEVFSDLRNAPHRIAAIKKIDVLTDGPIGAGTRFRETRVMFKKEATDEMEITEFSPRKSYTVCCQSCGAEYRSTFRFEPNGPGTDVHMSIDARPVSFFAKIMSPVMSLMVGPMLRKCIEQDLKDLKAAIENEPK